MRTTLGRVCCIRVFIAGQGDDFFDIYHAPPTAIICINSQAARQGLRVCTTIPAALLDIRLRDSLAQAYVHSNDLFAAGAPGPQIEPVAR